MLSRRYERLSRQESACLGGNLGFIGAMRVNALRDWTEITVNGAPLLKTTDFLARRDGAA